MKKLRPTLLPVFLVGLTAVIGIGESIGNRDRCGDRLERALDLMKQRRNYVRRRLDLEDLDVVYHQTLRSAPIEVSVTKLLVEVLSDNYCTT